MSADITNEVLILTKLLRRNSNQHGHTKLYQHLKKLKNKLQFYNDIDEFNAAMQKSLNVAGKNAKLSILELNMLSDCINDLTKVVITTVDSIREVILCNELVKQQLDQLIFVPLNTIFTALLGKIMTLLLRFYDVYVKNKEILVTHLQHIKLTQVRYKELIEKFLVHESAVVPRHTIYTSKKKRIDQVEYITDVILPRTGVLVHESIDTSMLPIGNSYSPAGGDEEDEEKEEKKNSYNSDDGRNSDDCRNSDDGRNVDNESTMYEMAILGDMVQKKRKSSDLLSSEKKKKKKKKKHREVIAGDSTGIDDIFSGI